VAPEITVFGELEQKLFFVAAVCNMPDMAGQEMTMSARHGFLLKAVF
jgi:hypothetical protein